MTNDKPDGDPSQLVRVIAWLVPSATTLLVIAGFVASTAHFAFLGFDPGFLGATMYSGITAEFLRDVASVVLDLPRGWGTLLIDYPRSVFLVTCLLVLVSLRFICVRKIVIGTKCDRTFILIPLLLLIVLVKFALMDGPLMRVESVLVSISEPSQSDTVKADSGLTIEQRLLQRKNEGFIGRYSAARARDLWHDMKCSRLNRRSECERSEEDSFLGVRAEFLAHLFAAVFVGFIVSWIVRHTKSPIVVAAALLSALSCLTLPYAYGKLVRSTNYTYGVLLINHGGEGATVAAAGGTSIRGSPKQGETVSTKRDGDGTNRSEIAAFVLLQDANFTSVLMDRDMGNCPADPGQKAQRRVEAKLSQIANNQILSIKEIRRQDVIRWKALVESQCPDPGPPN